jgi:hypothetical protein
MLLDMIAIPVVFTLMFTYLLGGALAGSPHRYLQFILPGTLVMAVLLVSMYAGTGLAADQARGISDRFGLAIGFRPARRRATGLGAPHRRSPDRHVRAPHRLALRQAAVNAATRRTDTGQREAPGPVRLIW